MALLATSRQKRGGWRHESYSEQIRTVCHQPVPKSLCNFLVKSQVSGELNSKCKDLTPQCESKAQGKKSFPGFQGSNPKLPLFQFHFNFHVSQYKSPTGLVFGILGVMSSVWEWCNSAALRWICGKMGALARTSSLNADSMWLV